jgi:hypothetical protein
MMFGSLSLLEFSDLLRTVLGTVVIREIFSLQYRGCSGVLWSFPLKSRSANFWLKPFINSCRDISYQGGSLNGGGRGLLK